MFTVQNRTVVCFLAVTVGCGAVRFTRRICSFTVRVFLGFSTVDSVIVVILQTNPLVRTLMSPGGINCKTCAAL